MSPVLIVMAGAAVGAPVEDAGYTAGREGVAIALDPAASEFHQADGTHRVNGASLSSDKMIEPYTAMVDRYPIWSIEDGLSEADTAGWKKLTAALDGRVQLVGDDNFCTNPAIITAVIADGVARAALIKVNQIGTVTETLEPADLPRGRLRAGGLPSLRRDTRHDHRRPRRRHRLRSDQVRRPRPRRTRRQAQPANPDRGR